MNSMQDPSGQEHAGGLPDPWADPDDLRAGLRRNLRRCWVGFSTVGLALIVASLYAVGLLAMRFTGLLPLARAHGLDYWGEVVRAVVVWVSLVGVALLCGRWPDRDWGRRAGFLLMIRLVDVVLWTVDHSVALGLSEVDAGHAWFRFALGQTLNWSKFALIASLSADVAAHLGEGRAIEMGRAARARATTGAMAWLLFLFSATNWRSPFWPLRQGRFNPTTWMLSMAVDMLFAIALIQSTALCLLAGRWCGLALRKMAAEDRDRDRLLSPSEAGWDEFAGRGG